MSDSEYSKLSQVLADVGLPDRPEKFVDSRIFRDWLQAAGEPIADNTVNLSIDDATISVTVNSPTWAHLLVNNQSTILLRLAESGYEELKEMAIRVNVPTKKKSLQATKSVSAEQPKRVIEPRLKNLFAEIAENANNPRTRDAFLRLSKIDSRNN